MNRTTRTGRVVAFLSILLAAIALVGWLFAVGILKGGIQSSVAMNPTTAVFFILMGFASIESTYPGFWVSRFCRLMALVVMIGSLLKLSDVVLGTTFDIDTYIFSTKLAEEIRFPSRMAPNTAIAFLLISISLLLINARSYWVVIIGQLLATLTALIALVVVVGYLYDVSSFEGVKNEIPMALNTACCLLLLCVAILFVHSDKGLMSVFHEKGPARSISLRLLPYSLGLPFLVGWVSLVGQRQNVYSVGAISAVSVVLNITVLLGLIYFIARKIFLYDRLRRKDAIFRDRIIESLPGIFYVFDSAGHFHVWNQNFEKITGHTAAEISQSHPLDYFSTKDKPIIAEAIQCAFTHGQVTVEADLLTNCGEHIPYFFNGIAADVDGQHIIIGVGLDISERKQVEAVLIKSQAQAQQASIAKSRFLATMSHEIRTPMNGILGMAQMLLIPNINDYQRREYAKTILASGNTLLNLLNDVLDISRIEAGKIPLNLIAGQPSLVLREVETLFLENAHSKSLVLESHWLGSENTYLIDHYRLCQMLANLVGNAIKFTHQGRICVEAREIGRNEHMAMLRFSVSDTGIGISEEAREILFEPFSQVDSSITRKHNGSGLGLSIVRRLAKMMDGDCGFESELGKGSRFWFTIKAQVVAKFPAVIEERGSTENVWRDDSFLLSGTILVVEDNRINRTILDAFLGRLGLCILFAEQGQQAVDIIAARESVDLILMDLHMPVMDGYTATEQIRQWEASHHRPRHPIIAVTSDAFAEDRQRCITVGMDDFLTKPLSMEAVRETLKKWLPLRDSAASAASSQILDESLVIPMARELLLLLEDSQFDAIDCFLRLQEAVSGTPLATTFANVGKLVEHCHFDLARKAVHAIMTTNGWVREDPMG